MRTLFWVLLSFALGLATPLLAQSAEATYAKARLYETTERDLKSAIALYEEVGNDAAAGAELRAKAWLALGLVLERLGQAEPARAALGNAAAGAGKAAQEAKARLAGQAPAESQIERRVGALVEALRSPDEKIWMKARGELQWIGAPAVPALVEAVGQAQFDLELVGRLVGTLLRLGGPPVEKFLDDVRRSPDVLLRRAVARGFTILRDLAPATREAMARFVEDADAGVRAEALQRIGSGIGLARLVGWCQDADAAVRRQAIRILAQRDDVTLTPEVLAVLRPQITDAKAEHHDEAIQLLRGSSSLDRVLRQPAGRELFLDFLAGIDTQQNYGFQRFPFGPPPSPERVIAAARAIGPVELRQDTGQRIGDQRQQMLMAFVDNCLPAWRAAGLPVLCELMALDYDYLRGDLGKRLQEMARPEDVERIARLVVKSTEPARLAQWARDRGAASAAAEPLLPAIEALLAKSSRSEFEKHLLRNFVAAAAVLRTRQSLTAAARATERLPELWQYAVNDLTAWKSPDQLEALAILVGVDAGGPRSDLRTHFLWRLVQASHPDLVRLVPHAYELGLGSESDSTFRFGFRGLLGLFGLSRSTNAYVHELGDDTLTAILTGCLAVTANIDDVWQDVRTILVAKGAARVPPAAIAVLCKSLDRCPEKQRLDVHLCLVRAEHGVTPEIEALVEQSLGHASVEWRLATINAIGAQQPKAAAWLVHALQDADGNVRAKALGKLGTLAAPDAAARAASLLADPDARVRSAAVGVLVRMQATGEIERVLPLVQDRADTVKLAAIAACRTWLDVRATEALLGALRDDSEEVRKAAREALDAIRYYHEQQAHWQKWLQSKGATSPADALLKQCAAGEPKKVRLAAIQALGTLADPQALPFLIEMMKEGDAEIAAAAEAAVQRLNAKK